MFSQWKIILRDPKNDSAGEPVRICPLSFTNTTILSAASGRLPRNYYVDPVTLFLNIVPEGSATQNSVGHDATQFMIPASAGLQGLYLFEFPDSSGALQIDNPPGLTQAARFRFRQKTAPVGPQSRI